MKRTLMFTRLFVKRLLRKPSFLIILLLMPVMIFSFRLILDEGNDTLRVALINEDKEKPIENLIEKVCVDKGVINFYVEESEDVMKREVLNGHTDSGFVFREGTFKALLAGDATNMITMYSSNKSTVYYYALEKLYSELYYALAFEYMQDSLVNQGFYELPDSGTREEAREFTYERFLSFLNDGGVFEFHIDNGDMIFTESTDELMAENKFLMRPVRGTLAVFIMLAALSGAIYLVIDERNGVYKTLGYGERPLVNMGVTFIPTMLGGIVAYASLLLSGLDVEPLKEAGIMLLYVILVTVIVNLLRCIVPNEVMLCSLLPLIVVVAILGCDVFLDLSVWVKPINTLRYLLLPHYYLEVLRGPYLLHVLLGMLAIAVAGILVDKKRMR